MYNSDSLLFAVFSLFRDTVTNIFTYNVTICMKLDPGIHMVMHSVLFLKLSVTEVVLELYRL